MFKFKVGDEAFVLSGKGKTKKGKIEKIFQKEAKIIVSGVNIYKRHKKVSRNQKSGIYEISRPIDVSKVAIVCPKCAKPTRVGFLIDSKLKKRICKKCKGVIA